MGYRHDDTIPHYTSSRVPVGFRERGTWLFERRRSASSQDPVLLQESHIPQGSTANLSSLHTSAKALQTTHTSKVWALPETPYLVCSLFWDLFPSSYSKPVNPKRESRARFLKEIQLPMNLSERWSHRTINPKLMITNQLLDTTLQAMVDSSWNKNIWELDLVLWESIFTVADTLVQALKMFIFKLRQKIPNNKENATSQKEVVCVYKDPSPKEPTCFTRLEGIPYFYCCLNRWIQLWPI